MPWHSLIGLAGSAVIATVFVLVYLRFASDDTDLTVADLETAAGVRVRADAQEWLREETARRARWVGSGVVLGFVVAGLVIGSFEDFSPWGVVSAVLGPTAGALVGTLICALRMRQFVSGAVRTVSLRPRRVADHLTRSDYLADWVGVGLASVGLTLGLLAIWGSTVSDGGRMAVVGALGVSLGVASVWTQRLLVARPRLAAAPEDRFWQEHLLAHMLSGLASGVFAVGVATASASAFIVLTQPAPGWLYVSGIVTVGLIVGWVAYFRWPRGETERVSALDALEIPA